MTADEINVDDLLKAVIPPPEFVVPGLLPVGLHIIGGAPSRGKSWLVLDLCLSVASGGRFLDYPPSHPQSTLYFGLEDSLQRLRGRFDMLGVQGTDLGRRLSVDTDCPPIGEGFDERLLEWIQSVKDPGLVVVDTLSYVRPPKAGTYESDYSFLRDVKEFANDHRIAVLFVTHTIKTRSKDAFAMLSGSQGVMAAGDTRLVLEREPADNTNAKLYVIGKDVSARTIDLSVSGAKFSLRKIGSCEERSSSAAPPQLSQSTQYVITAVVAFFLIVLCLIAAAQSYGGG